MNIDEVRELAKIVSENGIQCLEVTSGDTTVKIKMPSAGAIKESAEPPAAKCGSENSAINNSLDFNNLKLITSPMVGVFYTAASPDSEPFVKIGDRVKKGDILCIIEAMKLMNDIVADQDGEIVDICVENGQTVEYSQTLFKIF